MTDSPYAVNLPIRLAVTDPTSASPSLRIELRPAPPKPVLGDAGKATGEIVLDTARQPVTAIVSLGKPDRICAETFRKAGGALAKWLLKQGIDAAELDAASLDTFGVENGLRAFLEGVRLGSFRFERRKQVDSPIQPVTLHLRGAELDDLIREVTVLTEAIAITRDWGMEPANIINPLTLVERAQWLAERYGLKITVLDDQQLREMGAGAIVAVGQGSLTPARMVVLEYAGARPEEQPVVLVGKAITFDTGGYSIKSVESIRGMKYDKMGGLTMLGILAAAAELRLTIPVVGIVCAAENAISGAAYRPDDILTTLSGKTVEILTTDAEGRLVLADGLTYGQREFKPRVIIDLATLTGGVVTALGRVRAGIMSNNRELTQALIAAGETTYERLWELPLDDEYLEAIRGDDGDLKNSGGREAHPIMGGIFLKQFIENDLPWAHVDIAGTADTPKDLPYAPKGATGFGVRLIIEYLRSLEQ